MLNIFVGMTYQVISKFQVVSAFSQLLFGGLNALNDFYAFMLLRFYAFTFLYDPMLL